VVLKSSVRNVSIVPNRLTLCQVIESEKTSIHQVLIMSGDLIRTAARHYGSLLAERCTRARQSARGPASKRPTHNGQARREVAHCGFHCGARGLLPRLPEVSRTLSLCGADQISCHPVPGAVTTYFGSDQPRITVEVSLPWRALGLTEPPSKGQLRIELAATAWHRSRWMSWSGLPPVEAMQDLSRWHLVRLAGIE
jgi:hypothetical protein